MQKPESSLQKSRTIGNYIITKNLGEGTFGKVKLGIHSSTGEKVAIKILEKSKIVDVADVERVTRQIHILKQIRHPNLIQLYEIIETPKQLFLVMEYVSEGELFENIVKKKKLKESQACEYFRQLIAGVEYMHELNIVHRDLKPENLLIDFNKRLKIVDFGLSNTYKNKQVLKTACGSPCYAAPEMIAGKKYQGLNADIWSCGVILFAMICGYLPFEDPNTSLLYKKITAGDFNIPKSVSPFANELLRRILTTDPERRYKISDIKSHAWYKQPVDVEFKNVFGIRVGHHSIPVDEEVVQEVVEKSSEGNSEQIRKFIANNRHNHAITIYYLILKRNLRNNIFSQFDICSPTFDQENLIKKQLPIDSVANAGPTAKNTEELQEIELDRTTTATGPRNFRTISRNANLRSSQASESPNITAHNFYVGKSSSKKKKTIEETFESKMEADFTNIADHMHSIPNSQRRKIYFQAPKKGILSGTSNGSSTTPTTNSISVRNPEKPSLQISLYDVQQKRQALSHYYHQQRRPTTNSTRHQPASFRTSLNHSIRNPHIRKYQDTIQTSRELPSREVGTRQGINRDNFTRDRYVSMEVSSHRNNGSGRNQQGSRRSRVSSHQQNQESKKEQMNRTFVGRIPKVYGFRMDNETDRIKTILNNTITTGFGGGTTRRQQKPVTRNTAEKFRFEY